MLAKFVANMSLIVVTLLLSASYAVVLGLFGDPDFGPIYSGYFRLFLFGTALVGTGLLASALTTNQVVAALISLGVFPLLWIIDNFDWLLPSSFDTLVVNLSLSVHFRSFAIGSVYLSDLGFFFSIALLTLLSARSHGVEGEARVAQPARSNIVLAVLVVGEVALGALGFAGFSQRHREQPSVRGLVAGAARALYVKAVGAGS